MVELFGVKVYQVEDVIEFAGKMKHVSDPRGKARLYSYGGTVAWVKRALDKEPAQRGLCMRRGDVEEALAEIGKAAPSEGEKIATMHICALELVRAPEFARLAGMSLSNLYKKIYNPKSRISAYFQNFHGGFAMTLEEAKEVAARLHSDGSGPRPTRYRRSSGKKKGAGLRYDVIEPAIKLEVIKQDIQGE